jgi:hypothetical protein
MKTQDDGQLPNAIEISGKTLRSKFFKTELEPGIYVMHFLSEYSSPEACKAFIDNKNGGIPLPLY